MRSELVPDQKHQKLSRIFHTSVVRERSSDPCLGRVVTWRRVVCERVGFRLLHQWQVMATKVGIVLWEFVHHKFGPLSLRKLDRARNVGVFNRVNQRRGARDRFHAKDLSGVVGGCVITHGRNGS